MAEEVNVQSAIKKGQVIARFCHPSALQIIQQWIARLKKRWEEVSILLISDLTQQDGRWERTAKSHGLTRVTACFVSFLMPFPVSYCRPLDVTPKGR